MKTKKPTLANIKKKWRWKARSKMSPEELDFFLEYIDKKRHETIMLEEMLEMQNKLAAPWVIVSPMFLPIRRKQTPDKKESLNMNGYRNWDFMKSDMIKKDYKDLMTKYIPDLWLLENIHVEYRIYYGKNEPDWMNIASVQSKFFLDTLQELGYLTNDNLSNVTESISNGWQAKWNERIEIIITKK